MAPMNLADFGLGGAVIAALIAFIVWLIKFHRSERKDIADQFERVMDKMVASNQESNNQHIVSLKRNTEAIDRMINLLPQSLSRRR